MADVHLTNLYTTRRVFGSLVSQIQKMTTISDPMLPGHERTNPAVDLDGLSNMRLVLLSHSTRKDDAMIFLPRKDSLSLPRAPSIAHSGDDINFPVIVLMKHYCDETCRPLPCYVPRTN
jgi:hypothetical protein